VRSEPLAEAPRGRTVDMKLEVVVIPVSDVVGAAEFYGRLGWRRDADIVTGDRRVLQSRPRALHAPSSSLRASLCLLSAGPRVVPRPTLSPPRCPAHLLRICDFRGGRRPDSMVVKPRATIL
jgi:hypothetical protein